MNTIEKKSLKVGKYVSTEHVDNLIRTYKKERWIQNSEKLGKEDSLHSWYSLEELEEFIQKAKDHGSNGIRLCFGVYEEHNAPKPEMEGKQTVALVATYSEQNDSNEPVLRDLYIDNNGRSGLLAYNATTGWPWIVPGGGTLGTLMIADKDKGMRII